MGVIIAPSYLPIHKHYADGGLGANDPTLLAYSTALNMFKDKSIFTLTLGAGIIDRSITEDILNGGIASWAPHIPYCFSRGETSVTNQTMDNLMQHSLRDIHIKLSPPISSPKPLDDCTEKNIRNLEKDIIAYLESKKDRFNIIIELFRHHTLKTTVIA